MGVVREPALHEICAQRPRLLRVERVPARGRRSAQRAQALLLTFDRLQLSVRPAEEGEALEISTSGLLQEALRADQEDPWWMLIGAPLVAAWNANGAQSSALELQFREDSSNPKIVKLGLSDGQIAVRSQSKASWLAQSDLDDADPDSN